MTCSNVCVLRIGQVSLVSCKIACRCVTTDRDCTGDLLIGLGSMVCRGLPNGDRERVRVL